MPLYVGDYIGDTGHLSTLEHGAYLLLIMHYWRHAGLPSDDRQLARIVRLSPDEWASMRDNLSSLFREGWRHKRIDAELAKASAKSDAAKEAAGKRWHKEGNADAMPTHTEGNADGMLPQPQSQLEPESRSVSLRSTEHRERAERAKAVADEFEERFWPAYPHKVSKKAAAKAFLKCRLAGHSIELILGGLERYKSTKPLEYNWKDPCRFLNGEHFNDEPAPVARGSPLPFVKPASSRFQAVEIELGLAREREKSNNSDKAIDGTYAVEPGGERDDFWNAQRG